MNAMNEITLCLNMIVKNESKIILRLLESVITLIDTYCICDTGSTDDTISIIKNYFNKKNIKGKIIKKNFENFEYNRNYALKECKGMADYILLMDADMILKINNFNKSKLKDYNVIYILQGSNDFHYKNIRIIKNNKNYKYFGVTHEYLNTNDDKKILSLNKNELFIDDIGDGGSKKKKFERDINLLLNGIEKEPDNKRYYFYLANSFRDIGNNKKAIEFYKKRIDLKGWKEEIWYSYYEIGNCYKKMNKMYEAIMYWLDAYNFNPQRLENIYEIINYYRFKEKYVICNMFYNEIKNNLYEIKNRSDYLFLHNDVYSYKLFYEYSIFAFYNGIKNINNEFIKVFNNSNNSYIRNNLLKNMKFYNSQLKSQKIIDFSKNINKKINDKITNFNSSSSCLIKYNNEFIMNIRYVNYNINSKGEYLNCENGIVSLNEFVLLDNNFNILERKMFDFIDEKQQYKGIEDVRIFNFNDEIIFNGVKPNTTKNIFTCDMIKGVYDYKQNNLKYKKLTSPFDNKIEKNWAFTNYKNKLHIIYKWFPLTICQVNNNEITVSKTIEMPLLFKDIRGSSCCYEYVNDNNKELWFVVHLVSYENPRHYYHFLVVFDENFNLIKYSGPFKFENKPIEYCLSIIVNKNEIIMNYSLWDKTTKIGFYHKNDFVFYNL